MKSVSLMFVFFYVSAVLLLMNTACAQVYKMYVGTYTNNSESKGVYIFDFDEKSGQATLDRTIEMSNPSFLARNGNKLYAVNEDVKGTLTVYDLAQDKVLSQVSTNGMHPCHIALSPRDPIAVVSNYSSGSLGLYSLHTDGSINVMDDFIEFKGSSVNKDRQKQSHIHSAFFSKDGSQVFVSDLGADLIYVFEIKKQGEKFKLQKVHDIKTKLGGGPRHLTFSKDEKTIYSILELTGEVEVFQWSGAVWDSKQIVPMFPTDFKGEHGGADIKVDSKGKYVYATNRGTANVVITYKVNKKGNLEMINLSPVYGDSPRNINFSPNEKKVIISNQNSNNIVILDKSNHLSNESYKNIEIPKSVCVVF